MTDPTQPAPRNASGRFVKRKPDTPPAPPVPRAPAYVHPAARVLFGWAEGKTAGTLILWGLGLAGLALTAADLFLPRDSAFAIATTPGFYGLFGFAALAAVVLAGHPLGALLRKRIDLYDAPEGLPEHTDPDLPRPGGEA